MATKNQADEVRDAVLEAIETSLEAQLRAIRRLRIGADEVRPKRREAGGMSQVDMAADILSKAADTLHISEIIERIKSVHGVEVDRESLVSALSKRVQRGDRFVRPGPNQFALGSPQKRRR